MTDQPIPLFLNPVAGRGRAGKRASSIQDILQASGLEVTIVESTGVGDLENRVLEHSRRQSGPFIIAGGDGSVYEAVNGVLRSGRNAPFGLVPTGTGNDFAKACGISPDWEAAARLLGERVVEGVAARPVDAGKMNDRYFANGAGIGFDAKVNRIARKYRWPIGDLVYLVAVLEGLWDGVLTPTVKMTFDGQEYNGCITLANVSNGAWVGGMFYIAPDAENNDGHLDLVFAESVTRRRVLALLPGLMKGTHIGEPDIRCHTINDLELTADAPVPSHLDGEPQPMQTSFQISLKKQALRVL